MSKQVVNALELIIPQESYPPELVGLANNLGLQSLQKVQGLKPEEESARYYVCSYLAVEKCIDSLSLSQPDSKRAPVPPRVFTNLLSRFRHALFRDGSPVRIPSKNRIVVSRSNSISPVKQMVLGDKRDRDVSPSPSPSPVKRRGIAKDSDPKSHDLENIGEALALSDVTTEAISHGYRLYNNLVKERWGLLCGLIYVITDKAQPELLESSGRVSFRDKLLQLVRQVTVEKLEEWISWTEKIVTDQTWVRKITVDSRLESVRAKKKHASGIGNMLSYSMIFTSARRLEEYESWKAEILQSIE